MKEGSKVWKSIIIFGLIFFNVSVGFTEDTNTIKTTTKQRDALGIFIKWTEGVPRNLKEIKRVFGGRINSISKRNGVDPRLTTAIIAIESSGDPNVCSKVNACGLMQLKKGAAKDVGLKGDIKHPWNNIWAGTKYLARLKHHHKFRTTEEQALAFRVGPGRARNLLNSGFKPSDHPYITKLRYVLSTLSS